MKPKGHMEPIDMLLFIGMMVFSVIIFVCNVMFPMDGQIFQVYSGVLGGFTGAFFARLKDSKVAPPPTDDQKPTSAPQPAQTPPKGN